MKHIWKEKFSYEFIFSIFYSIFKGDKVSCSEHQNGLVFSRVLSQ